MNTGAPCCDVKLVFGLVERIASTEVTAGLDDVAVRAVAACMVAELTQAAAATW